MIALNDTRVYLAKGPTDMRNQINGLLAIVSSSFALDAFDRSLFCFCNRRKDILKILVWDTDGFWLHTKRLERGHFLWPGADEGSKTFPVSAEELALLLSTTKLERRITASEVTERSVC